MMAETLTIEQVYVSFSGKQVVRGAAIHAKKRTITGLLGRNGSGKSTLLKAAFGIIESEACDVFADGTKIKKAYRANRLVNYLPQKPFLPGNIRIEALLKQFEVDSSVLERFFPELIADYSKRMNELSGGAERLWSAVLLILAPTQFTMLDEPFTHIMPLYLERLKQLLLWQQQFKGFILTDHLYQSLLDISNVLYFMKDGNTFLLKNKEDLVLHQYISQ
jgi:lipopolysaccharide export system ATP-binding protein